MRVMVCLDGFGFVLEPLFPVTKGIRLLGINLSSFGENQLESEPQLSLSFQAD
jgi:hypothetical protein